MHERFARRRHAAVGVLALLSCTMGASHAHAAGTSDPRVSASDAAEAEQLFDAAKDLMNAHDYAAACPKFAASQSKDPAAGTLLNLANCYAKNGQTASAWVTFKDAATAARAAHRRDWETLANKRVAELAPQLSHLKIRLAAPTANVTITRDDRPVAPEQMGTPILVDPGMHHVGASAPGKLSVQMDAVVGELADTKEVVIPELADVSVAAVPVATPTPVVAPVRATPDARPSSPLRTVGLGLAIVGGAGLVVGAVTGILTIGKNNDAKDVCPNAGACGSQSAVNSGSSAQTLGTVSSIGFIAGGALAAGGLALYFFAPRHTEKDATSAFSLRVNPLISRDGSGIGMGGTF